MAAVRQLVERPRRSVFPNRPNGLDVKAFEDWIARTGEPETFERISLDMPPIENGLKVLLEFSIRRKLRADGEMAPCPICKPEGNKYLHGILVWCPSAAAIYAIGYECAARLGMKGLLDREITTFRAARDERTVDNRLLALLPTVPALRAWIEDHAGLAEVSDRLKREFQQAAPRLYARLLNASKGDGELRKSVGDPVRGERSQEITIGRLSGRDFLVGKADRLGELYLRLGRLERIDCGPDPEACLEAIVAMSVKERRDVLALIDDVARDLRRDRGRLDALADFVSAANIELLQYWTAEEGYLTRIRGGVDERRIRLEAGREIWSSSLVGLRRPSPVP